MIRVIKADEKEIFLCLNCGKEFHRPPNAIKKYKRHFCSIKCWSEWRKNNDWRKSEEKRDCK